MHSTKDRPFRTLAVIGAGNMGSGIAQKMATEGFEVVLVDLDAEKVSRGLEIIRKTLAEGVARKIFKPEAAAAIEARIRGTADWRDLAGVDLAVEAVFEDREVKKSVFRRLDEFCREDAALATNTSSFSVSELASSTRHPGRVLGLHYFYHPAKNRLVEVVPGKDSDPSVLRRAWALQEQLGKTPIASADRAGFVVNRFFVPWLNEAVRCLEEGLADIATIEEASKRAFGVGLGPFELMNVTGVPIALHAATTLGQVFGPLYEPAALLRRQVDSGAVWTVSGVPDEAKFEAVADRLRAVTFLVAAALVEEGVGTVEDTDIGARVGLRWPKGPFEMINRYGVDRAGSLVAGLARRFGLAVPRPLAERAASGRAFEFRLVRMDVVDGIATITLNRPDAMNALNEDLVAQTHAAFRAALADPAVRGIVIAGAGKAFIAGADVRFFVRNIEAKNLDRIVSFTKAGHALLDEIDRSPKPVVGRLDGLALGGGLELALACDVLIATPRASMAFPETGIGIYPGLGGTQRATRRVGVGLAKWLVFTGRMLRASEAQAIGLVDEVVPHEELDGALRRAIETAPSRGSRQVRVPDSHRALDELFRSQGADALREGKVDTRGNEDLARAVKSVAAKAPLALRLAGRLIEEGAERPLADGLRMELDHLLEIFSTRDAYEGLKSVGQKPPVYEGR